MRRGRPPIWKDSATYWPKPIPAPESQTIDLNLDAVAILERHPLMGRPAEAGLREPVISRGKSGYIALYRYDGGRDRALVLAVRHQREAGYAG